MSSASERASPGKELRARLRSEKRGICHLAEVMTHAAVLLHLHRPSPRKCLRGGAPRAAWVAGRKKLAPALGSPAGPVPGAPPGRAAAGHSWLRLPRRSARSKSPGTAGGRPGRKTLESVSPAGLSPPQFGLCALEGCLRGGVRCSAAVCGNVGASFWWPNLCSPGFRVPVSPPMGDKGFVVWLWAKMQKRILTDKCNNVCKYNSSPKGYFISRVKYVSTPSAAFTHK